MSQKEYEMYRNSDEFIVKNFDLKIRDGVIHCGTAVYRLLENTVRVSLHTRFVSYVYPLLSFMREDRVWKNPKKKHSPHFVTYLFRRVYTRRMYMHCTVIVPAGRSWAIEYRKRPFVTYGRPHIFFSLFLISRLCQLVSSVFFLYHVAVNISRLNLNKSRVLLIADALGFEFKLVFFVNVFFFTYYSNRLNLLPIAPTLDFCFKFISTAHVSLFRQCSFFRCINFKQFFSICCPTTTSSFCFVLCLLHTF